MRIYRYGLTLLCVLCFGSFLRAQGGIGDPAVAPGSPASSYALNGLDHINYYNGLMNTAIPILTIGGRGSASRTITIPIQRQWVANTVAGVTTPLTSMSASASYSYTFGSLSAETVNDNPYACSVDDQWLAAGPFLTYLVWHGSDGTVSILWDTKSGGQAKGDGLTTCSQLLSYQQFNRERIFRSADGTNLTFIADQDVVDQSTGGFVTGTLITKDGLHFKITTDSYASQIEDRNGNLITTSWQGTSNGGIYTITDPVGRATTANYTADATGQDVITYPGYNGNSRTIRVNYTLLQNVATEPLETYHSLFPELNGASSSTQFNPSVISSIVLADGSQYTMQYNAYGELAKLTLPTGGYYTYSYWEAHGSTNGGASGVITLDNNSDYRIIRPLRGRDEYSDGVHLSAKLVLSYPPGGSDPNHSSRPVNEGIADFEDANGTILRKEIHFFYGNPFSTAAPSSDPTAIADWWEGLEFQTYITDGNYNVKQEQQRVYGQRPCGPNETCSFTPSDEDAPAHDPELCQTLTTLDNGQAAGAVFAYDQFDNITDKWEYGYGMEPGIGASCPSSPGSFYRHTKTDYLSGAYTDPSVNLIGLPTVITVDQGGTVVVAKTQNTYDGTSVANAPGVIGHDNVNYAGGGARGNLTNVAQCSNAPACTAWVTQTLNYDIAGNVVSTADGNGHVTQYGYNDDPNNANTYARVTSITNIAGQRTLNYYDTGTGKLRFSTDPNGVTTAYEYNDSLDRLTHVDRAGTHTNYVYSGTNKVTQYQMQTANWDMPTETDYDGLGRAVASKTYEDANNGITTYTAYNALGLVGTVSNPLRAGDAWNATTYGYDPLERPIFVVTPDNALTTYSYVGPVTTVTDPAGKVKNYTYDSLGRLLTVVEDPNGLNFTTNYGYDALDDLFSVTQGSQTRVFNHDSLGRLTSAANPESGTVTYDYDNASNLLHKTDARGVVTTYGYDALNRVIDIGYNDGTPPVHYSYDASSGSNAGIGRLASVTNSYSTMSLTYDALGRVITSQQDTNGQAYNFAYGYNAAGALTVEVYPSGRIMTMGYDAAGRETGISGARNGATANYAQFATYAAQGGLGQVWLGNTMVENYAYNNRLQMSAFSVMVNNNGSNTFLMLQPQWGTTNNNGNLLGMEEYNGGAPLYPNWLHFTQTYGYDGVNRLHSVTDTGYTRTFDYDQWGNRWVSANSGVPAQAATPTSNIYNANNRMTTASFDAAGNQLGIGVTGLTYDAENRQASAIDPPQYGGTSTYYRYDGLGQRVEKAVNNGLTVYVYDAFGRLAAEYTNFPNPPAACTTCYLAHDHLGSTRMVTDQNGNLISRHDLLPFGEEIQAGAAGRDNHFGRQDFVKQMFTGQERDQETGLDYFKARYMSAPQGRFLSADPANAGADPMDPQTWNAYAYVRNSPLNFVDPSGMEGEEARFSVTTKLCKWWQVWCYFGSEGYGEDPGFSSGWDFVEVVPIWHPISQLQLFQQPSRESDPPKKGSGVCVGGIGAGLTAGADAGIGLGAGAVGTVSVGAGVSGAAGRSPDAGAFLSYGAAATTLRKSAGIPPQNQASPLIFGAAAGAGVGAYLTNASQTSQLSGPFMTFGVDFGYLLNFSAQAAFGSDASGHPIFEVSGTVGGGGGAMVYVMTTNTKTAGIKSPCGGS